MITDRDIAIRGVAEGRGPLTAVREAMSGDLAWCFDDEDSDEVLSTMGKLQIRRMPVMTRDKRLCGIVSLGDLAARGKNEHLGEALSSISRPGGQHSQTAP